MQRSMVLILCSCALALAVPATSSIAQTDKKQKQSKAPQLSTTKREAILSAKQTYVSDPAAAAKADETFDKLTGKQKVYLLRQTELIRQGSEKEATANCAGMDGIKPDPVVVTPQKYGEYFNPFGANFNVGASFGDTGANGVSPAQNTIQTEVLGRIEYESSHFFYDFAPCLYRKPTISFGGTVGLEPDVVMENLSSKTATIAVPNNRPMYQDAFVWRLGPKLNFATSMRSQFSIFATLGQTYIMSQVSSFKQGTDDITATPVSNGEGQAAIFAETGVCWQYLGTDIPSAYLNKTDTLTAPFNISAGVKKDKRFNGIGDLAGYKNPQDRAFVRFNIGLNQILNWGTDTSASKGANYTFKFGVDYERPISESRMPVATRYYLSADFDLIKIFKPAPKQP